MLMSTAVSRARCLALIALCTFTSLASAQTMEIFAGGGYIEDSPGPNVPVVPLAVTFGPDGKLYVAEAGRRILRFDTETGTATALPGLPPEPPMMIRPPEFTLNGTQSLAFDTAGQLFASTYSDIFQLDLEAGELVNIGVWGSSFGTTGHMAFDSNGYLYFAKQYDNSINRRNLWGGAERISASEFEPGFWGDGGPANRARFAYPRGVATDVEGNIYVADTGNNRIRRISADLEMVTTVAGTGGWEYNGDGIPATSAALSSPNAVTVDALGNLYINDTGNARVRRVDAVTGLIETVAGSGEWANNLGDGGPATAADLDLVWGNIAVDANSNLYLAEMGKNRLRRVDAATGIIDTVLGNGTINFCTGSAPRRDICLAMPTGVDIDATGNVYIADANSLRIWKVDAGSGLVTTFAGTGFSYTHGGDGGPASEATFSDGPWQVRLDAAGNFFVAGGFAHRVRRIDGATGIITTVAGTGEQGFSGDGGPATAARFNMIIDVLPDANGNLFIADANNHRIRRIDASTGIVTTVAGNGQSSGPSGDGWAAISAVLVSPDSLAFDSAGNLLFADGARIRRIDAVTGIISHVAGTGYGEVSGDNGPATAAGLGYYPPQITLDPSDNIILSASYTVRRIDANTGIITSLSPPWGLTVPEAFGIQHASGIRFDHEGRLLVADSNHNVVFRVSGLPIEPADDTPPVVEAQVTGVVGLNGWYTSNVQVTWSVVDEQSEVSSQTGCENLTLTQDNIGMTLSCSATSRGGTAASSVLIRRDATPPTLAFGVVAPAADAAGWNNSDVSIPFTTDDALSGVRLTSTASPVVLTAEGAGIVRNIVVSDNAGNSASFTTPAVSIDRTPPVITHEMVADLGNNGWYLGDVTRVNFTVTEMPQSLVSMSEECDSWGFDEDTPGITLTCTATSAGGTSTHSVTIKRDATPPVLTFGAASPLPNANGWNKTNVSVLFTHSDALSGVASASSTSPVVISAEGAGVAGQVTVTDLAGNTATFTTEPRNIDKTPPVVSIVSPANGASFGFYQDVAADFSCTDVSLLSCTAPVANGAMVNTRTAGARTFKVTGKDLVNFTASVTNSFTVASLFNFDGFLAPASAPPTLNLVTRGSLVPIRWKLPDGNGGFVSNPLSFASATVGSLSCGSAPVVPLNDTATGPAGIHFDAGTNTFTYNWATNAGWTGCRKLTIKLRDNTLHELRFRFQ
jgi:sugar lactone lactonase YvrE